MKLQGLRPSICRLVPVLLGTLGMVACGYGHGGGSYSSITGYMTGQWDFTVTNAKGRVPIVIEADLNQDHHGNISAPASVTANGPTGNVSTVFLWGGSLSATYAISLDYLGFTCNGTDNGDRSITGTINSSNQVTLTLSVGGSEVDTITGTLSNFGATPAFTGTLTSSGACGGPGSATVTGQFPVVIYTGTYSGTSAADNTETITMTLTEGTSGSLTGNGTDSKLGNFTLTGNAVGNAFSATLTYASSPGNSGPVFGYFDQQVGRNGSILLVSFLGPNSTSCPNGEPYFQGTCQIAAVALP
jgi:hypothetical protein